MSTNWKKNYLLQIDQFVYLLKPCSRKTGTVGGCRRGLFEGRLILFLWDYQLQCTYILKHTVTLEYGAGTVYCLVHSFCVQRKAQGHKTHWNTDLNPLFENQNQKLVTTVFWDLWQNFLFNQLHLYVSCWCPVHNVSDSTLCCMSHSCCVCNKYSIAFENYEIFTVLHSNIVGSM